MAVPLISTKLYRPPTRRDGVARARLSARLLEGTCQPGSFALLSGPAGFGKTTLLSEFAAQLECPVAWLSLDTGDDDPIRFWTYLISAVRSVLADFGEPILALLSAPMPLPAETVPALLINGLAVESQRLVLVLDDYHTIQGEDIHNGMSFLLEHMPENLYLVAATRVDPPWPLARFRARNRLIEIRTQDLRFTTAEAAAFLNQMMGLNLTPADVAALEERTEGWIAGLQLAALSMRGRSDTAGFIRSFTGSHIYIAEYLMEEVLRQQPAGVQEFLLKTSILDRLTASLCEAVSGCSDAQSFLLALQRANLFVMPLDDEARWFRYHHLFADLLRARLRQALSLEASTALHQRAARWFEQAGMMPDAIGHAITAQDYEYAASLIAQSALPMIIQAYVRTVEGWLQAVPSRFIEANPRANMAYAWMNILRGTPSAAEPYLQRLHDHINVGQAFLQDASLQGEWLALQSELLNRQGKPAQSLTLARQALEILPDQDTAARSMVHVNLAASYEQMLHYEQAAAAYQMIVSDARTFGNSVLETLGISGEARMFLMQGKLHTAFEIASEGIRRLETSGRMTPFSATLYGELGQIYYHWHQLDLARQYLQQSVQLISQSGYSDPEIYLHVMFSRMHQMAGDWQAASREMDLAAELERRIPPAMIREEVISQRVRVDLACGRLPAALALLSTEGFIFENGFIFPELSPGGAVPHQAGLLYNSALRALLVQTRSRKDLAMLAPGIRLAALVLDGELQCQHIPAAVETLLLRSQMHAILGELTASQADVSRALELAGPDEFISIFVEEGAPIAKALADLKAGQLAAGQARYIDQLLAAFPQEVVQAAAPARPRLVNPAPDGLVEPLTARELEVLALIAGGDSNSDIAGKLFITVSAVKKHTANIYGKLGVNSRTQAVARARQLQLFTPD